MARLIGTAGHVDHGKTTLIKALTGIDADRLPEEKRRGMTIDVGFAPVEIPRHGKVSLVDVPGHERFIHNMLVGALGVDVALLCVAADDAVMPQTTEHLQILELLPVDHLVVALTRCDLADPEMRELARADTEDLLAKSRFKTAPIIETSATTGTGLAALREALATALDAAVKDAVPEGPWYLPIDRAFSVKGHGLVVTGTLARGQVKVGETAFLEPGHVEVRVRMIQVHGDEVPSSERGRRTALNLSGVHLEEVHRGMTLGAAGAIFESSALDARIHWLADVKHGARVRVSIGAEEVIGKAFLNDAEPGLVQLRLERPVAVALDQPLIVRQYSPPDLLGGGKVLVPVAAVRRKSERVQIVESDDLSAGVVGILGDEPEGISTDEICRRLGQTPQALGETFEELRASGRVLGFAGLWMSIAGFETGRRRFLEGLRSAHDRTPTAAMIPRDRAVSAGGLKWAGKPLDRIVAELSARGDIATSGTGVRLREFQPQLPARQREFLNRVIAEIETEVLAVPSPYELSRRLNVPALAVEEVLKLGQDAGELLNLGEGIFYTPRQIEAIKEMVRAKMAGQRFSASELRVALDTSRKYIIPLLEHLDSIRFTHRVGDTRAVQG